MIIWCLYSRLCYYYVIIFYSYVLCLLTILRCSYNDVLTFLHDTFCTNAYFAYILIKCRVLEIDFLWNIGFLGQTHHLLSVISSCFRILFGLRPKTFILEFNILFDTKVYWINPFPLWFIFWFYGKIFSTFSVIFYYRCYDYAKGL